MLSIVGQHGGIVFLAANNNKEVVKKMMELNCVKPGAKPGQVILAINLSQAGEIKSSLAILEELGYTPTIQNVSLRGGVNVFAFLKDEQYESGVQFDYLMSEWLTLRDRFNPRVVHLWRGYLTVDECRAS